MSISPIPRIIWQTWRTAELPSEAAVCRDSWISLNPGWDYRFMDDAGIDRFVRETVPADVYSLFRELPLGVMKADFWRYLVTRRHGGIYTDIDTLCLEPLDEWLPRDAEFVICPENNVHLCQWTFLATPGHPCLDAVVDLLIARAVRGIDTTCEHFVHFHTGPGLWTDALRAALEFGERDIVALAKKKDLLRAHELKVRILDWKYFNGFKVRHLFGSRIWDNSYGRWIEERDGLLKKADPPLP